MSDEKITIEQLFDAIDETLVNGKEKISVKELPKALLFEGSKNFWAVADLIEKYHTLKKYLVQNSNFRLEEI